jgi:hypothetical protein
VADDIVSPSGRCQPGRGAEETHHDAAMTDKRTFNLVKPLLVVLAASLALTLYLGWRLYLQAQELQHLVVAGWGDSKYGKAFYGARVYYVQEAGKPLQVWLSVQIDRGSVWTQYSHEPRLLGEVNSPAEAVAAWGQLSWTERGLQVGRSAGNAYLFPTAELERHR